MIHIVDDDEAVRDALAFLLASRGIATQGWPSGEAFLEAMPVEDCACVILDVRMAGLSGPEVFERLRAIGVTAPAIFLAAMDRHAAERAGAAEREALAARLSGLSAREDEVMRLMLQGLLNKQIAADLGIAMRTVEVHRGRVLAKLGARNVAELALLLAGAERGV